MKLLQNAKTLLSNPEMTWDYFNYWASKLSNSGQAMRILPNDIKVTGLSGFSEFHSCVSCVSKEEREFLQEYPMNSGDLIDIGANLGIISAILSKRFPERQVHAFEPNPSTFQALQANVAINGLTNVQSQQCAVSEYDGEVSFRANPVYRATCCIATSEEQYSISVPCTTLDYYIEKQSIKEIAFMKVDVEGYETIVFQGAKGVLQRKQAKIIYYEVCPILTRKAGFKPELPTQILLQSGYKINKIQRGCLVPVDLEEVDKAVCENWIAIPK